MEIKIKHSFNELYQLEIDEKGNMGMEIDMTYFPGSDIQRNRIFR